MPDQNMTALAMANDVRTRRAELKRQIAVGDKDVRELLADPPQFALKMPINQLLQAQHRYGPGRVRRLLTLPGIAGLPDVVINEKTPIGRLTVRQRTLIAERVR